MSSVLFLIVSGVWLLIYGPYLDNAFEDDEPDPEGC
jgi:hypothetical protein